MLDRTLLLAGYTCAVAWLAFHLAGSDHLAACLDVYPLADCAAWMESDKE